MDWRSFPIANAASRAEALILVGKLRSVARPDPRISFDAAAETRAYEYGEEVWPLPRIENAILDE